MPFPMKKKKKAPEGSAAEEGAESPKQEKGESPEYGDAPHGKKPCAACRKKGKKKGSCGCSGAADKGKMDAALTPQEYLDACDLGIQRRSPAYIRARLDAAGQGQKCGNGYIGRGKKCNVGGGGGLKSQTEPQINKAGVRAGRALRVAAAIGGTASNVGSVYHAFKGNAGKSRALGYASSGFTALGGQGKIIEGKASNNESLVNGGKFQRAYGVTYGLVRGALTGDINRTVNAAKAGYRRAQIKKNNRYRSMSQEEYSSAARAAGNPEGPSRRWSMRKGSVNTTATRVPAGLLKGSTGSSANRKATSAEKDFMNQHANKARKAAETRDLNKRVGEQMRSSFQNELRRRRSGRK